MADAGIKTPAPAEEIKPVEEAPAENGSLVDETAEPPKKRGRPSSGAPRRSKTPRKVKIPQEPTRRSTRRSVSRSSEASTPTEKNEEPMAEIVAEKENVDENKPESKEEAPATEESDDKKADGEKTEPAVEPAKPVEAEA